MNNRMSNQSGSYRSNETNNNINITNITNIKRPAGVRYGKPAGRLSTAPVHEKKHTVDTTPSVIEEKKSENIEVVENQHVEVIQRQNEKALAKEKEEKKRKKEQDKADKLPAGKRIGNWFKNQAVGAVNTVTGFEKENVRSVKANRESAKTPVARIVLCGLLVVLLMFVIMDYVKIFENNQMISDLKAMLEDYNEQEKKLSDELAEQFDIVKISEEASSELGMVSGENHKKVYVDISEDDTIEGFEVETEDYGAIATIMNALGDSAQAWFDVVKDAISGNK